VVKIAEALLGPNELSEFLTSDKLAWTLYEGCQNFEGLVLKPNPSPVFKQLACIKIQVEPLKTDDVVRLELIHAEPPEAKRETPEDLSWKATLNVVLSKH
jgi:hypothetical protein